MPRHCPIVDSDTIAKIKDAHGLNQLDNQHAPIDETAIIQALAFPETPYFITTNLYWDCECRDHYIKPQSMLMCEDCGELRADAPPSRINELRYHGIHVDWTAPEALATLTEHSQSFRHRRPLPIVA